MKDKEKNLIENLFYRLKQTELNSSERDISADTLIQNLVSKQPSSPYYMTQTILIQETAIKKMSIKIEELEKNINALNMQISNKKPSFLSSFFKTNPNLQSKPISDGNNIWNNKENISHSNQANPSTLSTISAQSIPAVNNTTSTRSNGFLSSALQTATGVAGGMILGNMLMNVFSHSKPEEEIFDTVHQSISENHLEEDFFDHNFNHNVNHHDLIDYQSNELDVNQHELTSEDFDDHLYNTDDFDANEDNFI